MIANDSIKLGFQYLVYALIMVALIFSHHCGISPALKGRDLWRGEQECRGGFRDSLGWLNDN